MIWPKNASRKERRPDMLRPGWIIGGTRRHYNGSIGADGRLAELLEGRRLSASPDYSWHGDSYKQTRLESKR